MTRPAIEYLDPPRVVRATQWESELERRISNWVSIWDFEEGIDAGIVGVPLAKGAILPIGSDTTPDAIRKAMVYCTTYNPDLDVDIQSLKVRHLGDVALHVTEIRENHRRIESVFADLFGLASEMVTVVVGGNGTITAPIVRAFARANGGSAGMVVFDSRVDSRAVVRGRRERRHVGPRHTGIRRRRVPASSVCHIGSHGFVSSQEERTWAREQGVTLVTAREARLEGRGPGYWSAR